MNPVVVTRATSSQVFLIDGWQVFVLFSMTARCFGLTRWGREKSGTRIPAKMRQNVIINERIIGRRFWMEQRLFMWSILLRSLFTLFITDSIFAGKWQFHIKKPITLDETNSVAFGQVVTLFYIKKCLLNIIRDIKTTKAARLESAGGFCSVADLSLTVRLYPRNAPA